MELEEKKVVLNRWNIVQSFREKEWWFSYLYDERAGVYFSWCFARAYFVEKFRFWFFDLKNNRTWTFDKNLFLDQEQEEGVLDLEYQKGDLEIHFKGDGDRTARFHMDHPLFKIDLDITRRQPAFTKRDNYFVNQYALLHYFGSQVRGSLEMEGHRYEVDTNLSYYDHCFGKVPARTGWHWVAAQNDDFALASLINHGPYAQKYTQVFFRGEWIRLSEDVSFDYDPEDLMQPWRLTSVDLDLRIEPMQVHEDRVAVPPVVPFLVNIRHNEFFVKVTGKVRVQGVFHDIGALYGVMEEHSGRW